MYHPVSPGGSLMTPQWSLIKGYMLFHSGGLQTPGGGLPILWLTNQYKQKKNPLRCSGTPRMSGRPFTALSPGNTAALCIIFIQSDKTRTCTRSRRSENLRGALNNFSPRIVSFYSPGSCGYPREIVRRSCVSSGSCVLSLCVTQTAWFIHTAGAALTSLPLGANGRRGRAQERRELVRLALSGK